MSMTLQHERSAHGIQPKCKDCTYDPDKNPAGLVPWLTLVSGVVSAHGTCVSGGAPLENFLNHHLAQQKGYTSTKPSFLDDPNLQLPDDASDAYVGSPGRSNDMRSSMPSSTGSPPPESGASPEQDRGVRQGNRDAAELYELQKFPKRY